MRFRILYAILIFPALAFGQLRVLPGVAGKNVSAETPPVVDNITDISITVRPDQYIGTNVSVTATPTGTVTSWRWRILHRYFHTGGRVDTLLHETSTVQNPTFSIDSTGFYDVQLIARNGTDKFQVYKTRLFHVFAPRFTEGEADLVINMSSGSQFHDFRSTGDHPNYKIYLKGQTTNGYLELVDLHGTAGNPVVIQKANDNTQVTIQFSGGSGKPFYFSRYGAGQGARHVVVNGFNVDGTPGIKVTAGASSTTTVRVEGKLTDVGFYGIEVVSDPVNIDGAAIAIVPTVASDCQASNWETNNLHMWHCLITAGEEAGYFGESLQDPDYVDNNGFPPPQGTGIVMSRNTILGAGRDGLQSSLIGEGEDNYISNWGQQNGQSGEGGHQACLVSNDGSAMKWRRNYCINGEYFANIKSGEYPWAPFSGQTTPQETVLENNVYSAGTYPNSTDQEPFAIYIQNNPESGAGNWTVSIRNNIIDTDKKGCEFLLALGGFTSHNFTFANNVIIKSGNAGDSQALNFTGNGKATLQGGTKTENNIVFNQGDDVSALEFTDRASGDYEPLTTDSSVYDGSPSSLTAGYDFFGFPIPLPGTVYFYGPYSLFNKRTISP